MIEEITFPLTLLLNIGYVRMKCCKYIRQVGDSLAARADPFIIQTTTSDSILLYALTTRAIGASVHIAYLDTAFRSGLSQRHFLIDTAHPRHITPKLLAPALVVSSQHNTCIHPCQPNAQYLINLMLYSDKASPRSLHYTLLGTKF